MVHKCLINSHFSGAVLEIKDGKYVTGHDIAFTAS